MNYEVEFSYLIREYSATVINADNPEQAEDFAYEYIRDTYPEAGDVIIEKVAELKVPA